MKLSYTQLKSLVSGLINAQNTSAKAYTPTRENTAGLLDKIGKMVSFDTDFVDPLKEFDGDNLELGRTIEEWNEALTLPTAFNEEGSDALTKELPNYFRPSYSKEIGKKTLKITITNDDLEKASLSNENFASLIASRHKKMYDSEVAYRYELKRGLLSALIDECIASMTSTTVFPASAGGTPIILGTVFKESSTGTRRAIAVKNSKTGDTLPTTFDDAITKGYLVELDLVTTMTKPKDETSSIKFIEQVKKDIEIAKDMSEGHSLNGNSLGASELKLYVVQGVKPIIDVYALRNAFNKEMLTLPIEVVTIKDFGGNTNKPFAILMDTRTCRLYPTYNSTKSNENGSGDFINIFKHLNFTAHFSKNTFVKVYEEA